MSTPLSVVAGRLGTTLVSLLPQGTPSNIGGITIQALIEEQLVDTLEVTDNPVESGSQITDHSFMRPFECTLRCGWSNATQQSLVSAATALVSGSNPVTSTYVDSVYAQLQYLQQSRTPFDIVTTLRQYQNMLITQLTVVRDEKSAQALMVTAVCRQVILASTQTGPLGYAVKQQYQHTPENTASPIALGQVQPVNVGPITSPAVNLSPASSVSSAAYALAPSPGGSLPPSLWSPTSLSGIGSGSLP